MKRIIFLFCFWSLLALPALSQTSSRAVENAQIGAFPCAVSLSESTPSIELLADGRLRVEITRMPSPDIACAAFHGDGVCPDSEPLKEQRYFKVENGKIVFDHVEVKLKCFELHLKARAKHRRGRKE